MGHGQQWEAAAAGGQRVLDAGAPPFEPYQQQAAAFGSRGRADAADSWRRPEGGALPPQQQQQQWGSNRGRQREYFFEQPRQDKRQGQRAPHDRPPREEAGGSAGGSAGRSSSNVLPFRPPHRRHSPHGGPRAGGAHQGANATEHAVAAQRAAAAGGGAQLQYFDDDSSDTRPILLFDMNGTLTSHTSARRSAGRNRPRPGTHHLRRLSEHFRVGVFTSATVRTVNVAVNMLEAAAGEGPPIFDRTCILHREHTLPVPDVPAHVAAGGKPWDTVKPLSLFFRRLHRVLIVDDDAYKAAPGEKANMVLVPRWEEEDPQDTMVEHIVAALLGLAEKVSGDPEADLRPHTVAAAATLAATAERLAQERSKAAAAEPEAAPMAEVMA